MQSLNILETELIRKSKKELISWLMNKRLIKNEKKCDLCFMNMAFKEYKRNKDSMAWRCYNKSCKHHLKYSLIRLNSFFSNFTTDLITILRIIIRFCNNDAQTTVKTFFADINHNIIEKIYSELIKKILDPDFYECKLGNFGTIVQIDETMLNYKCKSHRGRSPENRSDALCIIEFDTKVTRVFATLIENKLSSTLIPIICNNVLQGATIWTDEHRSYSCLRNFDYLHNTVCHKYNFVNPENGVNTQAVESFNNILKHEIKKRKGIKTTARNSFLKEICFRINNRDNFFESLINLLI